MLIKLTNTSIDTPVVVNLEDISQIYVSDSPSDPYQLKGSAGFLRILYKSGERECLSDPGGEMFGQLLDVIEARTKLNFDTCSKFMVGMGNPARGSMNRSIYQELRVR